ncbi:MAG: zf-HC2 domain-containing protein [Lachnospiraceae bacterium]|nr:zf-HC2 domain-containing protein [Lachnospiraceae bacterium]
MKQKRQMKCREAQKLLIPFIDDKLNAKELEAFLQHMDSCANCREEYDVYYTMLMGMRYLESDSAGELKMNSEKKLRAAEDALLKYKIVFVVKVILLIIIFVGAMMLL